MRNRPKLLLVLAISAALSSTCQAESQIYFTDTCTLPSIGASTASCSLSSSIGGSNSLTYTRYNLYGGVHEEVPDGVTATGRFASLTSSNVRYGILFDTFEIFQSPTTNLEWAVSSTGSSCPASTTYNWLLVRTRTPDLLSSNDIFNQPMDFSSSSQYVGGTVSYSSSSFTGTNYFDLASLTDVISSSGNWSSYGFNGYNSATCSSGTFTVQGTGSNYPMDEYGYVYFGDHSFFDISAGGNPVVTLGVVQQNLTSTVMSGLANDVLTGFFTYYPSYLTQDQRTVYFVPNGSNFSGSTYEFDIYQSSTNLNGGSPTTSALTSSSQSPSSQTQLGKITCTSLNSPSQGFCSGTLDMSASGVSGTGNAVCEFYTGTTGHLIACTAQYPAKKSSAVSFIGQTPSTALLSAIVANSGLTQIPSPGSSALTATLTNLSGRSIPTMGNPSDLGESSSLNLASPFAGPSYSGTGGVCGTKLAGYGSCTLSIGYTTSADGANLETFRAAYDSGGGGTVNATAIIIGTTALSSIALATPTTGTSENLTATATFSDNSTANVSDAVTWATTNSSVASVTNDVGNSTNGYATIASSGIVKLTATLGDTMGDYVISPFTSGTISTFAGVIKALVGSTGDGGPALAAKLGTPYGIAIDSSGSLYIGDYTFSRIQMTPTSNVTFLGQSLTAGYVYSIAGSSTGTNGATGDGGPATSALLKPSFNVAVDSSGNFYVADYSNYRIQMVPVVAGTYFGQVMTAGYMYTIAGITGVSGSTGDGGAATAAKLLLAEGVAVDSSGNVYIADTYNEKVRMVAASTGTFFGQSMTAGYIYRLIGSPSLIAGYTGNGGPATSALLHYPSGLNIDSSGNLFIADLANNRIQMIPKTSGTFFGQNMTQYYVYTVAGSSTGTSGLTGDGGAATSGLLSGPYGVTTDSSGNLYIADTTNNRIQMVPATTGTFYGQSMTANDIYTVAGNSGGTSGSTGDGWAATSAYLNAPHGISVSSSGTLFILDTGTNRVRMVPAANGTFLGNSVKANYIYPFYGEAAGSTSGLGFGNPAVITSMGSVYSIAVDSAGDKFAATGNRVLMIPASTGTYFGQSMIANDTYDIAGNGTGGSTGDGGIATSAELGGPYGVAADSAGNVYIADTTNNRIRMVPSGNGTFFGQTMTAGYIYTIAGGSIGTAGDGGPATSADFDLPQGVTVDRWGNLYVADTNACRVQMVPAVGGTYFGQVMTAGYMYTIAGIAWGTSGYSTDGGAATSSTLNSPPSVAVDSSGNLYIADGYRVRMVPTTTGTYFGQAMTANDIYTLAGSSTPGTSGIGGPATSAKLGVVHGITLDSVGNLYISDNTYSRALMVPAANGINFGQTMTAADIYTIAGMATYTGYSGDGFAATSAWLALPRGIAIDSSGILYISDTNNYLIRAVYP